MHNPFLDLKYLDEDSKLLNPYNREHEPADGDRAFVTGMVSQKGVDEQTRSVSGMVSTKNIDRYEEIIEPRAFKSWLPTFMGNPQFLAGHKHVGFDAAEPTSIGQWTALAISDEGLDGTARFMDPGDTLAEKYWQRYRQGVLRAFSVGVIVHQWEMREFELEQGVRKRVRVLTECELIEISAVAVPANRQALVRAASLAAAHPHKAGDTFDAAQLVKALADELRGFVAEEVNKTLPQLLNAEPGGPLYQVLLDIADTWSLPLGAPASDPTGDVTEPAPPASARGHPALDYILG